MASPGYTPILPTAARPSEPRHKKIQVQRHNGFGSRMVWRVAHWRGMAIFLILALISVAVGWVVAYLNHRYSILTNISDGAQVFALGALMAVIGAFMAFAVAMAQWGLEYSRSLEEKIIALDRFFVQADASSPDRFRRVCHALRRTHPADLPLTGRKFISELKLLKDLEPEKEKAQRLELEPLCDALLTGARARAAIWSAMDVISFALVLSSMASPFLLSIFSRYDQAIFWLVSFGVWVMCSWQIVRVVDCNLPFARPSNHIFAGANLR